MYVETIFCENMGAIGSDMVATVDYHSSGGMRTYEG